MTRPTPQEIAGYTDNETLDLVATALAESARWQAVLLRGIGHLNDLRDGDRSVADELAPAMAGSRRNAEHLVGISDEMRRLPCILAAMDRGEVDIHKVGKIAEITGPLTDEICTQVDAALAERITGKDPTQIRRTARDLVHRLDGPGANERAEKRREDRRVEVWHDDEAMATLAANIPAETASAIYSRIDTIARTHRTSGEQRTLEQLRADVFTDLLLGTSTGHRAVQGTIYLHIPIGTALGITEHGCTLEGHGPIPGSIARQILNDPTSIWRTVLTDPTTGTIRDIGRTRRRPPAALAELIRIRDRECRMPACHRPAHHSDLDHARPWRTGGTTSATNLHSLCRRHNLLKENPAWRFDHNPETGTLTITTPAGRTVEKTDAPDQWPQSV